MIKNTAGISAVILDKVFHFTCENDAPLALVKDALVKFLQYIGQLEDQLLAQQKAAQEKSESEKITPIEEPPKEGEDGNQQ